MFVREKWLIWRQLFVRWWYVFEVPEWHLAFFFDFVIGPRNRLIDRTIVVLCYLLLIWSGYLDYNTKSTWHLLSIELELFWYYWLEINEVPQWKCLRFSSINQITKPLVFSVDTIYSPITTMILFNIQMFIGRRITARKPSVSVSQQATIPHT